ncbi:HisA/HisF-related TIM barrel protein [bacterium]|nr:HisA/HisF-related TIM barrel protein [bacterium]
MLRKRLIGSVIVRQGWAVQSFGYKRWLPLGKPECLVENLDRWGADGIVVLAIDRGDRGPDLALVERLAALGLSTPLTYGGGLVTEKHARAAVRAGAERLVLDSVLSYIPEHIDAMASAVGVQALVASLPMLQCDNGQVHHLQHATGNASSLSKPICELIANEKISEVLVIDAAGEGEGNGFNQDLLQVIEEQTKLPLLAFGGMSGPDQIRPLLSRPQVAGVVIGNSLNYCEHAIGQLKAALIDQPLRPHVLPCSL